MRESACRTLPCDNGDGRPRLLQVRVEIRARVDAPQAAQGVQFEGGGKKGLGREQQERRKGRRRIWHRRAGVMYDASDE